MITLYGGTWLTVTLLSSNEKLVMFTGVAMSMHEVAHLITI